MMVLNVADSVSIADEEAILAGSSDTVDRYSIFMHFVDKHL